ncbi:transposase [Streptomyces sp. NPDC014622]|uniref:transposase n=1 Tax=Streptomyces sp. NPDC014622 TaxID=3364874 RepID=UPI0036FDF461
MWIRAERAGHVRPGPMRRLLRHARRDPDAVRDDIRIHAVEHLGTETGVQQQYTGAAGHIENARVGVFLACATSGGRALIDRRLDLPEHSWCTGPERRRAAGMSETVRFATEPRPAREMIAVALDAGGEAP